MTSTPPVKALQRGRAVEDRSLSLCTKTSPWGQAARDSTRTPNFIRTGGTTSGKRTQIQILSFTPIRGRRADREAVRISQVKMQPGALKTCWKNLKTMSFRPFSRPTSRIPPKREQLRSKSNRTMLTKKRTLWPLKASALDYSSREM